MVVFSCLYGCYTFCLTLWDANLKNGIVRISVVRLHKNSCRTDANVSCPLSHSVELFFNFHSSSVWHLENRCACRNVDRPELCQISLYDFQKFLQMDQKVQIHRPEQHQAVLLKLLRAHLSMRLVSGLLGVRSESCQGVPDGLHERGTAAWAHATTGWGTKTQICTKTEINCRDFFQPHSLTMLHFCL